MKRLLRATGSLHSMVLSVVRRCRPSSTISSASEEVDHVETASSSSTDTRYGSPECPRAHSACQPSSPCRSLSTPSDVNPSHVASDFPCLARMSGSRPGSPTAIQRPTSPTPITSRAHDLIEGADISPLHRSILTDWDNEDEHARVRWYMADLYQSDAWDAEQQRLRDSGVVVKAVEASPYQYIADAWRNEDEEVQARWHLQDRYQKQAWEYACAEAEFRAAVPFLKFKPTVSPKITIAPQVLRESGDR